MLSVTGSALGMHKMTEDTVDIEVMITIPRSLIKEDVTDDKLATLLIEDLRELFEPEIEDGVQVNLVNISDGLIVESS